MSVCPLDYGFCNQIVTLYHREETGIARTVIPRACVQWAESAHRDIRGDWREHRFLLVIPGASAAAVGDRVMAGVGPENPQWESLTPGVYEGVGEITAVRRCFWEGEPCHIEAEGV